ncbi:28S ribosomal protein S23, mitochondrial-like isoform X2 [Homarus americanus]|nr:28S ribosomal protein S23, mitochondrial-like isoform X2 [Homarus americanus]XP_042240653.1 28S ribosomal protein S23, mitochondrial-like isoform X2 [Homarus americanus]
MKPQDKPLWYDVYEAFPPKHEPRFDRQPPETKIRQIFYPEDVIRANFYKKYGSYGTAQLLDSNPRPTVCQLFVKEYERLQADGSIPQDQIMQESALALEARGIYLDRSRAPLKTDTPPPEEVEEQVSSADTPPQKMGKLRLVEIFKESQEGKEEFK